MEFFWIDLIFVSNLSMRSLFVLFVFLFLPVVLISQDAHLKVINQEIDSLIQLSREQIGKRMISLSWETIGRAKYLSDSLLDAQDPLAGRCLFNYGRTLHIMEDYPQAEIYYQRALDIQRTHQKTHAEDLAGTVNALAYLYSIMARHDEAESLYFEALQIRKESIGESHPDYATSVNNLGSHFLTKGNYLEAERYLVKAMQLREKIFGKNHAEYAWSLNNLGVLYKRMGKYIRAEELYIESRDIRIKILAPKHILVAASVNNLANLYLETERFEEAEIMYLNALGIWQEVLGQDHTYVAAGKNNLAKLYQKTGRFGEAESLYNEAMSIWKTKVGSEHPQIADGLHNLGLLYMEEEQYPKALEAMQEARRIRVDQLGINHPDFGNSENGIGQLLWKMGSPLEAENPLREASLMQKKLLKKAVQHLTEQEQADYAERFFENQDLYFSYVWNFGGQFPNLAEMCFDLALFHKGYVLEASQIFRQKVQRTPSAKATFNELLLIQQKLGKEYAKPIDERQGTESLEQRANQLEKETLLQVGGQTDITDDITWESVRKALYPGEGAIEFVHFQYRSPLKTDSIFYAAVVVRPDREKPVFIRLFEESEIHSLLVIDGDRKSDYVNRLYTYPDRGFVEESTPIKSLYELIWKALEDHPDGVNGLKTIHYSMTGLLHRLNLAALAIDDEKNLSDRYQLVQLGSTRSILNTRQPQSPVNEAVVFGGINYDLDSLDILAAIELGEESLMVNRGDRTISGVDQALRQGSWSYLKWTEKESSTIRSTLQDAGIGIGSYTDADGTEEAFKSLPKRENGSPGMIHLATHGYFFPDPNSVDLTQSTEVTFQLSANPMIRSGLILAGGNYAWSGRQPLTGREDGILTAYEISQMDLSNTQLVVLSACETGLGDIKGNEGVYGLQRAFKIAGVHYLIMSLWQVPDRETMQFMTTFYTHWLEEKLTVPEAFQKTQREMRDRFYNPYSWAGFVLVE